MAKRTLVFLLGAPGSGKGTQARILADRLNFVELSIGDLLTRHAMQSDKSEVSRRVKLGIMQSALAIELLESAISASDDSRSVVVDGFFRTLDEVGIAGRFVKFQFDRVLAVELKVKFRVSTSRLEHRTVCALCRKPSRGTGDCDCGGRLVRRDDDAPGPRDRRIEAYHDGRDAVVSLLSKLIPVSQVDGEGLESDVSQRLLRRLGWAAQFKCGGV